MHRNFFRKQFYEEYPSNGKINKITTVKYRSYPTKKKKYEIRNCRLILPQDTLIRLAARSGFSAGRIGLPDPDDESLVRLPYLI